MGITIIKGEIRDLGVIFMISRDLKRAEALFNEALEISKKTNHPRSV